MSPVLLAAAGGAVVLLAAVVAFTWRRTVQVPCELDLERTHDHLHAHVVLQGVEVEPGDTVLVSGAPSRLAYGEVRRLKATATVSKATPVRRWWTKVWGIREFYELYDVGFEG